MTNTFNITHSRFIHCSYKNVLYQFIFHWNDAKILKNLHEKLWLLQLKTTHNSIAYRSDTFLPARFHLLLVDTRRRLSVLNEVPGYGRCKQRDFDGFVLFGRCRRGRGWSCSSSSSSSTAWLIAGLFIRVRVAGWGWGMQKKGKNIKNTVRCKKKNYLLNMLIGTLKLNKVIERSVLNRGSWKTKNSQFILSLDAYLCSIRLIWEQNMLQNQSCRHERCGLYL